MHHFTHLGRPIDLRHASNRQAVAVTLAAGGIALAADVANSGFTSEGWRASIAAAGGAFLAWALGRELDPDVPLTALVAALLSVGTTLLIGSPGLLLMAGILFTARILLRPTGHPPRLLDSLGLLALGTFLGTRSGGWGVALVLAFAVARDRLLPGAPTRLARTVAALIAAGATGLAIRAGVGTWVAPSLGAWTIAGIGLITGATTPPRPDLTSRADLSKAPLDPRRLASTRRVTLAGLACVAILGGQPGIVGVAPAWATMVAVALVHREIVLSGSIGVDR